MKFKIKRRPVEFETMTRESAKVVKDKTMEVLDLKNHTIDDLITRSQEIADDCEDFMIVSANNESVIFNESAGLTYETSTGEVRKAPMSRWALSQLGTKIGVPSRYLEKCVATGRIDLARENVNSWLTDYNKDLFIREYRGGIRGILSNRYSVCDSQDILKVVDDAVDLSKYKIKGSYLSPERLHVRLVGKEMLPIEGEDLFAGLFIDSSDVGRNILVIQFGIWKQVCTNGLCISKAGGLLFSQKHIGITTEEFHSGLIASLDNVDALMDNAVEWVKYAQNKKIKYNVDRLSEEGMAEFVTSIKSSANIPEDSAKKVIDLMQHKYGGSQWGLINSLTEVAQDFTLDKRIGIETHAGNLLVA